MWPWLTMTIATLHLLNMKVGTIPSTLHKLTYFALKILLVIMSSDLYTKIINSERAVKWLNDLFKIIELLWWQSWNWPLHLFLLHMNQGRLWNRHHILSLENQHHSLNGSLCLLMYASHRSSDGRPKNGNPFLLLNLSGCIHTSLFHHLCLSNLWRYFRLYSITRKDSNDSAASG